MHDLKEKNSEYKFAITFLVASGTILFVVYEYSQNNPIGEYWYLIICMLISGLFIAMICFLLHIIFKFINDSTIYKVGLSSLSIIVLFVVLKMFREFFSIDEIGWETLIIIFFLLLVGLFIPGFVISFVAIFVYKMINQKKPLFSNVALQATIPAIFLVFFICITMVITNFYPLQGHIMVDMESIHHKNDRQIPVLIQVTGIDNNFSVILYEGISGNLDQKDYIYSNISKLNLYRTNKYHLGSNGILVGNYLGNGKYNIFINTTNLTTGYYELICRCESKYILKIKYEGKSFYLLNNSEMWSTPLNTG